MRTKGICIQGDGPAYVKKTSKSMKTVFNACCDTFDQTAQVKFSKGNLSFLTNINYEGSTIP